MIIDFVRAQELQLEAPVPAKNKPVDWLREPEACGVRRRDGLGGMSVHGNCFLMAVRTVQGYCEQSAAGAFGIPGGNRARQPEPVSLFNRKNAVGRQLLSHRLFSAAVTRGCCSEEARRYISFLLITQLQQRVTPGFTALCGFAVGSGSREWIRRRRSHLLWLVESNHILVSQKTKSWHLSSKNLVGQSARRVH